MPAESQRFSEEETITHVVPLGDVREHFASVDCWCDPTEDDEEPDLYLHHALDGREKYETGRRKLN